MPTPQCGRCGATTLPESEYVLNGQSLCALCYGLALAAGREAPVVPTDAEGLVRIDPPAEANDDSGGRRDGRPSDDPPDDMAAGRSADLLPAGVSLSSRCRPRIDDASVRPPAPAPADQWPPTPQPWT